MTTLLNLYQKYEQSGINGAPVINDTELKLLEEKLKETFEFLKNYNLATRNLGADIMAIQSVLQARKLDKIFAHPL